METRPKHTIDNPVFRGRLRGSSQSGVLNRSRSPQFNGSMSDIHVGRQANKPMIAPAVNSASTHTPTVVNIKPATKPNVTIKELPKHSIKSRPDLPKQKRSTVLKRQVVKPIEYTHAKKHRPRLKPSLLSGMAVVLFITGVLVLFVTVHANRTVKAQVKQLSQKTENDTGISEGSPSEANPPSSTDNYQVSADLPRLLTIDKIDVNAQIRRVGVGNNNILNAPANIFEIGWYGGSAKPGEKGTIVLDGHVSGPTKHGVFYSLGTLKSGDKISLERGDHKQFNYSVTDIKLYDNDKVDMSKVITSSIPGRPGLNLMTCAGRFNVRTNQFEQRVVVYTVQD